MPRPCNATTQLASQTAKLEIVDLQVSSEINLEIRLFRGARESSRLTVLDVRVALPLAGRGVRHTHVCKAQRPYG